jgi:hypothetical protein
MKFKLILRYMHYKFEFRNERFWLVNIAALEAMRPRPQLRGRSRGQGHAIFWPRGRDRGRDQHPWSNISASH